MGLRHRLDGLGRVLRGLDREDDVLSLAVHTHSVLLADSHVLGAIDHSDVVTSHQYAFRTFCLSVENMVILHPCFCFFMKALWFLTTFHTTSVDIYRTKLCLESATKYICRNCPNCSEHASTSCLSRETLIVLIRDASCLGEEAERNRHGLDGLGDTEAKWDAMGVWARRDWDV